MNAVNPTRHHSRSVRMRFPGGIEIRTPCKKSSGVDCLGRNKELVNGRYMLASAFCGEMWKGASGSSWGCPGVYYLALPLAFGFMAPVDVILLVCMSSPI